jgi:hypothetical protein
MLDEVRFQGGSLFEIGKSGTEVQMQNLSIDNQGGNRLDTSSFGFSDARRNLTEVNDLDLHLGIQKVQQGLFSIDTYGATSVVKASGSHLYILYFSI